MSYVSTYGKSYPKVTDYKMAQSNWSKADAAIAKCNREKNHEMWP